MHEAGLMRGLLAAVSDAAAREGAREVTRVRVRVGALAPITPEHLAEHFAAARAGTVAAGAELDCQRGTDILDPDAAMVRLVSIDVR